jgi:D-lactate dehydrogenase
MKLAFFSTTKTDKHLFDSAKGNYDVEIDYFEHHLSEKTVALAQPYDAVCVFVNDDVTDKVIAKLHDYGIRLILLRCAGFNQVNIAAANQYGMTVLRVPDYSPMAVAEHALAMMMSLNRKTYKAYNRVRDSNFSLEGLLGFDMFQKTAGVVGTGHIGYHMARILKGLGLEVLAYDVKQNPEVVGLGVEYVDLDTLYTKADIISLHVPLFKETHHLINEQSITKMKPGVMIINTSRGGILDASAVVDALKSGQIGYLGIDVYEQEADLFFEDRSEQIIQDDLFERLLMFPNVLVTAHQGFYTKEALCHIVETTLDNLKRFKEETVLTGNQVK